MRAETMKVCCCSRSSARALQSGALTQLEWIDRACALAVDGVEFAASHFPRVDDDYLAQLKKLCVDRGLTVASLAIDEPFGADVDRDIDGASAWIDRALALGSPIVRMRAAEASGSAGVAWRELVRGLKAVCAIAKARNVTVALEPHAGSQAANADDHKRAVKECDSSWLRLAMPLSLLSADDAWLERTLPVIAVCDAPELGDGDIGRLRDAGYLGFWSIDIAADDEASPAVGRVVDALRRHIR